jgi:molybdate transport system substrate-binding protein
MRIMSTVRIFTSNATHALLRALVPAFERAETIYTAELEADSAKVMLGRIRNGERADLAVLNAPDVDALARAGLVDVRTQRPFTRSRIGVAVRAGTPHPDIGSVDALRRALLAAHSIAHTVHGASGMYIPTLLGRLGIADKVKTVTRPGGLIGKVVASGEAEIAIQQTSELLAIEGIDIVGPLPDDVQMSFDSALAVFADASNASGAAALSEFFFSPGLTQLFASHGLERL